MVGVTTGPGGGSAVAPHAFHMAMSRPGANAIVLTDPGTPPPDRFRDAKVVYTPLDLIVALDGAVELVVLLGSRAREAAICGFLRESYPLLDVVAASVPQPRIFPSGSSPSIPVEIPIRPYDD